MSTRDQRPSEDVPDGEELRSIYIKAGIAPSIVIDSDIEDNWGEIWSKIEDGELTRGDLARNRQYSRFDAAVLDAVALNLTSFFNGLGDYLDKENSHPKTLLPNHIETALLAKRQVDTWINDIADDTLSSSQRTAVGTATIYEHILGSDKESHYEDRLVNALCRAKENPVLQEALNEIDAIDETTIGIEYELPVDEELDIADIEEEDFLWYRDPSDPLTAQERNPKTLELISDINGGIKAAALEIDQRVEIAENILEKQDIDVRDRSTAIGDGYAGMHVHIGTEQSDNAPALLEELSAYLPKLIFLTANTDDRNQDILSARQINSRGGGSPHGNISYRDDFGTIEYRIPDIHRDYEQIEAITAAFTGLQRYVEEQLHDDEYDRESDHNTDFGECEDSIYVTTDEERFEPYLRGEERLPDDAIDNLLSKVETGLKQIGTPYTDEYVNTLKDMFEANRERAAEFSS